ncbi:cytochrome c1 [Pyruvatibacter sp.]|uniref:cytochrome c1 n=1 Tax=Pyruvatibacter sp. TaxID=1981328 RepID=UPI0032EA9B35
MHHSSFKKSVLGIVGTLAMAGGLALASVAPANAAGEYKAPRDISWSWEGPFGTFDRAALQRGFQVYKEVCSACHGLKFLKYRNLGDEGGPGFSEAEVKAIAAQYQVMDGPNEDGDMFERPAQPKDTFKYPFENEQLGRLANNGAYPPDLTLMTKARDGGADYLYSLLVGYEDAPADMTMQPGMNYNPYFSGKQIAMAQPIYPDSVSYADGTEATVEQMAKDVTTFLHWAAEPKLEARKSTGFVVVLFLVILAGLLYFTQRKIWSDQH